MLPEGRYSAWFRTDDAEGMGVIELKAGRITGGDTGLSYFGTYTQDQDQFTATIRTERHSPGGIALFGLDEINITLAGKFKDRTGSGTGRVKQVPDVIFNVTLVRID
ncbi:hypothetical protein RPMA_19110 [Tardiphaga alba]|uniref:Type III secretion system (T3SS) negative regulator GrlR n=1 Tax=Tardiphaga alba TaxID=340268 RepID=A0ABX8AE97_9BRAD|nr:hypothetical protein [Tardiphaga alba]QUS40705.1 hypothetical protein RPMA_19110 [Tardiphaga alba]